MHRDNSTLESRVSSLEAPHVHRSSRIKVKLRKWRKAIPTRRHRFGLLSWKNRQWKWTRSEAKRGETRRDEAARALDTLRLPIGRSLDALRHGIFSERVARRPAPRAAHLQGPTDRLQPNPTNALRPSPLLSKSNHSAPNSYQYYLYSISRGKLITKLLYTTSPILPFSILPFQFLLGKDKMNNRQSDKNLPRFSYSRHLLFIAPTCHVSYYF